MKIKCIKVRNYRLLKDFSIDLEDDLSLILGKNNTGKTSFLSILEKFMLKETNNFSFDDFNIQFRKELKTLLDSNDEFEKDYEDGIYMEIHIEYTDNDNLSNIAPLILNLDPEDNVLVIKYSYYLNNSNLTLLKEHYERYKEDFPDKDVLCFLGKNHSKYYQTKVLSIDLRDADVFKIIEDKKILRKTINFQRISAKRDVSNVGGDSNKSEKTLSSLSASYYEQRKLLIGNEEKDLNQKLSETDSKLSEIYKSIFSRVISRIKQFGGVRENESIINIISTLEGKNILKNNTTVTYMHDDFQLPEEYNGLGYMNLINIIFEIEFMIDKFKKVTNENPSISDINLFFIEEPEAHTHPQMQYIFSQNIKDSLLESIKIDDGGSINLQTIITTHSPHIAVKSDFNDYKYFYRDKDTVVSKNISELEDLYGDTEPEKKIFRFIKQLLTLSRSELFFADKIILIEGDTERLLLTAMMKRVDSAEPDERKKLLSQNISIIEVGNYSHSFEKFIDYLGIKTLIITDIDTCKKETKTDEKGDILYKPGGGEMKSIRRCKVSEANMTTNESIKFFYNEINFTDIRDQEFNNKIFTKGEDGKWIVNKKGSLCVVYQTKQGNYHGRTFEDAFIGIEKNLGFIKSNLDGFSSIKNKNKMDESDAYEIAKNCIKKKTGFAIDILFNSTENNSKWDVPNYIEEGLQWIAK